MNGVPLRDDNGPRDMAAGTVVLVTRSAEGKKTIPLASLVDECRAALCKFVMGIRALA
jgi:hypothetical protein